MEPACAPKFPVAVQYCSVGTNGIYPALLNIKNRISDVSLGENDLILPTGRYRFSRPYFGEKDEGIKRFLSGLLHGTPSDT
jgi:hypothetical protein